MYTSENNYLYHPFTRKRPAEVVRRQRTGLFLGLLFCLLGAFLFAAVGSYAPYYADQSLPPNKMGSVGHWIAQHLFNHYFGISAILLPFSFVILGSQYLTHPTKRLSLQPALAILATSCWTSYTLAYLHKATWLPHPATWYLTPGTSATKIVDNAYDLFGEGVLLLLFATLLALLVWVHDFTKQPEVHPPNDILKVIAYQTPMQDEELVIPPYKEERRIKYTVPTPEEAPQEVP